MTCVVWRKLEEQNAAFFYAYSMRLRLKDQITAFNYLVRVCGQGLGAAGAGGLPRRQHRSGSSG